MSSTIYCFSGTGNSLYIAGYLAEKFGNCTIRPMTVVDSEGPVGGPADFVGFVFPVYYSGLPRIVKRFAEKLEIHPGTYCFAVVSHSGKPFDTLGMLNDILNKKDNELAFGCSLYMPGNFILKYNPMAPKEAAHLNMEAISNLERAAETIAMLRKVPLRRIGRVRTKLNNRQLHQNTANWDDEFLVSDRCTGCGQCVQICPVSNIRFENNRPVWLNRCERCLACMNWCPEKAIEYGTMTLDKNRYHNPNVAVDDMLAFAAAMKRAQQADKHSNEGDR